ncbi:MAG: amino acid permease [Phycisphaerales bacterium]|nr:amino acid permease [Phycisphaerales bacterium]
MAAPGIEMSRPATAHRHGGLGQLAATAICGNDITSSCLYVSALAILYAGKLAPLALLLVVCVLYLFRSIYGEVVGAIPLNGGAYNALLNTTSKFRASLAACLTILSYMATAVISASEAAHYAHAVLPAVPVMPATIGLLGLFMVLTILGITDSARVAVAIFVVHMTTLAVLIAAGVVHVAMHGLETLSANMATPSPGGFAAALFFGFSAAMLGISGFESSANFVEEQAEGVFPKTLRNMWIAVAVLNPTIALLALALIPIASVGEHEEALLAQLGTDSAGPWLATAVSIDAALVLSGAVLTSFVGVNGLARRMTLDRCLPQFLLKTNRRGTTHRIVVSFFVLTVSILLITAGELKALAGVYTISFLAVMALFGLGNILLKVSRAGLPRPVRASWPSVLLGIAAVVAALVGNAILNPQHLGVFLDYLIPAMLLLMIMLERIVLLKAGLFTVRSVVASLVRPMNALAQRFREKIEEINAQQIVFFTRGDNVANLNRVMLYIGRNEHTNRVKIVTVVADPKEVPPKLEEEIEFLDQAYPEIDVEFVVLEGQFGPKLIQKLSKEWRIPVNLMFIGSPGDHFPYGLSEMGGVRLII